MFKDPSINHVTIKGDNISPEAVTALLHYMYTALVDFSPKIASQVAALSVEYKVEMIGDVAADIADKGRVNSRHLNILHLADPSRFIYPHFRVLNRAHNDTRQRPARFFKTGLSKHSSCF